MALTADASLEIAKALLRYRGRRQTCDLTPILQGVAITLQQPQLLSSLQYNGRDGIHERSF